MGKLKQEFSFTETTKAISISSKKLEGGKLKQFFYKVKLEGGKGLITRKKQEKIFYAWVTAIKRNGVYHISISPSTRNALLHAINIIVGDHLISKN